MAYPSVTNTFVDGLSCLSTEVNTNFQDLINGVSVGDKDIRINNGAVENVVLKATGNKIYTTDYTDYSASTVVAGDISGETVSFWYKKIGSTVYVSFNITGTATGAIQNDIDITMTLPYNYKTTYNTWYTNMGRYGYVKQANIFCNSFLGPSDWIYYSGGIVMYDTNKMMLSFPHAYNGGEFTIYCSSSFYYEV